MSRLRVRIELNRRMSGVPLDKMASVVEETRKFFHLLSEDVHIEPERGEWLASDFDAESLNFTAEYGGPVSPDQVHAFSAAFSGATSLRRATIAQFTRIADFLGEDELVGFGLYQSDEEADPTEWRCLSKRDAMRFGEEIKLLAAAAGEQLPETQLPAVMNGSIAGRRLFKDRREREALAADPSKLIRDMESNLSRRIGLLEGEIAEQTRKMQQIGDKPDASEERFQKLLSAMETFWAQAPRQFPQLPAPQASPAPEAAPVPQAALPAPEPPAAPSPDPPVQAEAKAPDPTPAPMATLPPITSPRPKPRGWTVLGVAAASVLAVLAGLAFPEMQRLWNRFATVEVMPLAKPKPPAAPILPAPAPLESQQAQSAALAPSVRTVAARTSEPFIGPLIPLDIPAGVKSKIQSEVRVDVVVAIDEEGKVTGARVTSTKGEKARLLVREALRAAKQSRFRPAREGEKTVQSEMILTFLFRPESSEF
jgi:outer membrane biosynthesis protein TonB